MMVNFGSGKCPLCGDKAVKLEKETYHCRKCVVTFDGFSIVSDGEIQEYTDKYWN